MTLLNPLDLTGKNILVTGASSGIGKGIAIYLSRLGANIIMIARDENRLKETYDELEAGNHAYYLMDLNNPDHIGSLMTNICSNDLRLNGLVHSAGISVTTPLQCLKLSELNNIMSINFYSFIELVKHFSKRKNHEDGSSIVAISSISSMVGARGLTAYCASKGALESAVRAMALDLAPKKIRINTVAPGMIKTPIYSDLKEIVNNSDFENELKERQFMGLGNPEDVAYAAAFLLSDASKFITGTSLTVDGGYLAH